MNKFFYAMCVMQLCLIFILAVYQALEFFGVVPQNTHTNQSVIIIAMLIMAACTVYMMLIQLDRYSRAQIKTQAQMETIKNIRDLNLKLRAQRHDFMNHVQIIYSLAEMDEFDEVKQYLQKVYGELETVNRFARTEDASVNALLQAKYSSAERRSIKMQVEITASLRGLSEASLDICRILSNIIDNGMYSSEKHDGEKILTVIIRENVSSIIFQISNTGDVIPKENIGKIFRAGFTTKGSGGEGMGLFISKSIVEKYGGSISVKSENNLTEVTVLIPKYKQSYLHGNT